MSNDNSGSMDSQDALEKTKEVIEILVDQMGLDAAAKVSECSDHISVDLTGEDTPVLIGRKGQTLDALQYLTARIVNRNSELNKPIVVDSDDYRQRREESLKQLAKRLSEEVLEKRRAVALNPMSARDRRVIHLSLQDVNGISTRSEGDGEERHLLIVPDP